MIELLRQTRNEKKGERARLGQFCECIDNIDCRNKLSFIKKVKPITSVVNSIVWVKQKRSRND